MGNVTSSKILYSKSQNPVARNLSAISDFELHCRLSRKVDNILVLL